MGIVTIINTFDPSIIAIGGGVSRAEFSSRCPQEKVEEHVFYKDMPYADIRLSELGNDAV